MRKKFIEELNNLNALLIEMGAMCEEAINTTMLEIDNEDFDGELYDKVQELEDKIDKKEKEIESLCLKLIFTEQPVAKDLRFISSILKMVSDLERIGDQALDIADLFKEEIDINILKSSKINEMTSLTSKLVKMSVTSFVNKDPNLAKEVISKDNEVDNIFLSIKNGVIMMISEDMDKGESLVDILMIAKYLERIADHSVNIAEWVIFAIEG